MTFNYYPSNIQDAKPLGSVTLEQFVGAIKFPKKNIRDTFEKIRQAEIDGDMGKKNELKSGLYYFTPCVYSPNGRKYSDIEKWTGLMVLDFDHLEEAYAKEWKQALFDGYKCIIAAWLSASRHGVRALVKIPVVRSVGEFKEHFHAIQNELNIYRGWDPAPQNCVLPCYLSYDFDLLERKDYAEWTKRYVEFAPPPVKQYIISERAGDVEKIIASAINKIVDNGHPQLRAAAYVLGGYCGSGNIDEDYAIQMMDGMIDGNAYLSQKAKIYKGTARQMIKKGQSQPLFLK